MKLLDLNKIYLLLFFSLGILLSNEAKSQLVDSAYWNLTSNPPGPTPTTTARVTAGNLTSTILLKAYGGNGAQSIYWPTSNSLDTSKYFQFTVKPNSGYAFTIDSVKFTLTTTSTSPKPSATLRYSYNSDFSDPFDITTITNFTTKTSYKIPKNIPVRSSQFIYIRVYMFNMQSTKEVGINNVTIRGTSSLCINPLAGNFDLIAENERCALSPITDTIYYTSSTLATGSYLMTYSLSGANNKASQNVLTTFTSGNNGSFIVPVSELDTLGTTTLTISGIYSGNGCNYGFSPGKTIVIKINTSAPATPSGFSGAVSLCPSASQTYTITPSLRATSYTWSIPSGWTLNSGQGTTSINATSGSAGGNITVKAINLCGESSILSTSVTVTAIPNSPTLSVTQPNCTSSNGSVGISSSTSGLTYSFNSGSFAAYSAAYIVAASTSYSVVAKNTNGCISSAATGTMGAQPSPPDAPSITFATPCSMESATIYASGIATNQTADWYSAASGGTPLAGGTAVTTFTTPTISSNTTYYVQTRDTITTCISSRISVSIGVNPSPSAPTGTGDSRCGTGTLKISASHSTNEIINWYSTSSGGFPLPNGSAVDSFTTTSLNTTTTYYAEAVNNNSGCKSSTRTAVIATINNNTAISSQPNNNNQQVCQNTTAPSLSVTASGIGLTYQWYSNITASTSGGSLINGATSSSFTPASIDTGTKYYYCLISGTCGNATSLVSGNYKVLRTGIWLGSDSNWHYAANWCGGVPTQITNVIIPSSTIINPIIYSADADCNNIIIQNGASLLLKNDNTLKIKGTITAENNLNASDGTIELVGNIAQTISGAMFNSKKIKNLTISNSIGVNLSSTLNDTLKISTLLKFGNVNNTLLNTNNNLTLLSDSNTTASVGDMSNNNSNSGNHIDGDVTVERYISSGRKWRFLSIPTNTTQTYRQSWQEGNASALNSRKGYGTMVTDNNNSTYLANGFDYYSAGGPSVKKYNVSSQGYTPISSTSDIINISGGYMVYVRGDRSATPTNGLNTSTVLRTSGVIKQGDQPSIVVPAGKYVDIGNPFPSAINMSSITRVGVQNVFYLWDPKMGGAFGLGGYQTFTNIIGDYYFPTPGGYSYPSDSGTYNLIQSGQAFFVRGSSVGGSVTIKETDKATASRQVFRSSSNPQYLKINLNNSVAQLVDGATAVYGDAYQNAVDNDDALKITNSGVNISLKREGQLLSVEFRHTMSATDTLHISMTGLSVQSYQWNLLFYNLDSLGREAFLLDNYLNNFTPLNIGENNFIDFSVDNNPASKDAGRFKIIFVHSLALPVTITQVSAKSISDKSVQIDWKTESEISMDYYIVEKSTTGHNFQEICGKIFSQNNSGVAFYSQLDNSYSNTVSFYRIKAVSLNGLIQYSSIVKVAPNNLNSSVSVFPNPVIGKKINIQFSNMDLGLYHLTLISNTGQLVYASKISITQNSEAKEIKLNKLPSGNYQLLIEGPDSFKETSKLIIN